jgi:hypothetical protein
MLRCRAEQVPASVVTRLGSTEYVQLQLQSYNIRYEVQANLRGQPNVGIREVWSMVHESMLYDDCYLNAVS